MDGVPPIPGRTSALQPGGHGGREVPCVDTGRERHRNLEPQVITDAQGHASLSVDMPDSLTRWQVWVDAHDSQGRRRWFQGGNEPIMTLDGDVIFATSSDRSESLGDFLVREGRIRLDVAKDVEVGREQEIRRLRQLVAESGKPLLVLSEDIGGDAVDGLPLLGLGPGGQRLVQGVGERLGSALEGQRQTRPAHQGARGQGNGELAPGIRLPHEEVIGVVGGMSFGKKDVPGTRSCKVTGQIGKMTKDVYELKTPLASVGVRGTEYALRVFQSKGCGGTIDADDGMYIEVIKGLVDVQNQAGSEVIAKGETAYVPLPESKPEKVAVKPGVIKPVEKATEPVEPVAPVEEESSSVWWWLLGVVAVVLLI